MIKDISLRVIVTYLRATSGVRRALLGSEESLQTCLEERDSGGCSITQYNRRVPDISLATRVSETTYVVYTTYSSHVHSLES